MSEDSLTSKLVKVRDNVDRLCGFFGARRTWTIAEDASAPAAELVRIARAVDDRLRTVILGAGAVPLPPAEVDAEAREDGVLQAPRIDRFTDYLRELDAWFAAQPRPPAEPAEVNAVQRTQALIARTILLIDELLLPAAEPASEGPAAAEIAAPAGPADEMPTPAPPPSDRPRQLVLEDTDARPVVQEFRGVQELTPDCKQQVRDFLSMWRIEQGSTQHKKFLDRLLRWITSAPEGQVLVLKVNTVAEPPEPYPAYVSRELLRAAEHGSES